MSLRPKSTTFCIRPSRAATAWPMATTSSWSAKVPGMDRPSGPTWPGKRLEEKPTAPSSMARPMIRAISAFSSGVDSPSTERSPMTYQRRAE